MSVQGSTLPTLADWAKTRDPDGTTADIAEILHQNNDILDDIPFKEANDALCHRTSVRSGLTTPSWRRFNEGVAFTKGRSVQVEEVIGMMEDRSSCDKDLAELNGDVAEYRLEEAEPHFEGMAQEAATTLFYGDTTVDSKEFDGLAARYNSLSGNISQNVLSGGGGDADNTSIWVIGWGGHTVHGIFPKGSMAGLQHKDLGIDYNAVDANGNEYCAYKDWWQWKMGLVVRDWRYVVRIPNIDVSNLVGESSAADIRKLLIKALYRLPRPQSVKPRIYMNRTVFQMLDIQRLNAVAGAGMTYMDVDGKEMPAFRGVPIRLCDAITNAESAVS